jgi:hypothetical protein
MKLNRVFKKTVRTAQKTHSISVTKTNQLMLCTVITALYSEIQLKTNTPRWQNVELLNVKPGVIESNHEALKG